MPRDAFLLYVDDWLSSSRIELMDAHEERGYLRLLMRAWKQSDCGLPTDELTLAAWSKMGSQWFRETADRALRVPGMTSGQKVLQCFFSRDGRFFNERQLSERQYQERVNEKRRANGALGGRPPGKPNGSSVITERLFSNNRTGNLEKTNLVSGSGLVSSSSGDSSSSFEKEKTPSESKRKPDASAKNASAAAHGSRFSLEALPDDWAIWCSKELSWGAEVAQTTFANFRDYWISKAGSGARKVNWFATWRIWCRNEQKQKAALREPVLFSPERMGPTQRAIEEGKRRIAENGRL